MNASEYGSISPGENNDENINAESNLDSGQNPKRNLFIFGRDMRMSASELRASIFLATFFFLNWTYFAIFPTVFPHEAQKKGMNESQIGMIFAVFQLVLFLLYPVFGKYLNAIGVKFLFVGGLFLTSTGAIAFSFMDRSPEGMVYFILALLCRSVTGIGASMGISYAIISYSFPNNVGSVVALLEFVSGLGFMTGPLLGGLLFQLKGFEAPFLTVGVLMFVLFVFALFLFPNPESQPSESADSQEPSSLPMLPLLKSPLFTVTLLFMFVSSLGINFIEPNIQIHLLPLSLKPVQLGFVFFIPAFIYTILTPFIGFICDKCPDLPPFLMMTSSCLSVIAYSILGPIPFVEIPLQLPIFLVGYFIFGISYTGVMVPVYTELTKIAKKHGYPNDLRTQGLISGLFSCVHSFAAFLGPMAGGVCVQTMGYRMSVFLLIVMILAIGLLYTVVYFSTVGNETNPEDAEENTNTPLLAEVRNRI